MKRICLIITVCAALITLNSASVWEGTAAVAAGGELPETGLYMASNSFPVNTVVDVTNLENGKTIRLIASSSLETPGLLALLSRDAANAIGLQSRTLGRIRMSQPPDPVAFSRFNEGRASSGDPDFDPAAFVALNGNNPLRTEGKDTRETAGTQRFEGGDLIVDLPDENETPSAALIPVPVDDSIIPETGPQIAELPSLYEPETVGPPETPSAIPPETGDFELSFVPSEARPPETGLEPDPAYFIPGISPGSPPVPPPSYIDPSLIIDPVATAPMDREPLPELSRPIYYTPAFSAPLINSLEKGMYYLQIAAYSREEAVHSEVSKIDSNLPVAIMNAGSAEKPIYRILIGPVNLGESGALLQRYRTSHKDAFVRLGK